MSSIVIGVGASHSTLMNTHWAEVDHLPEAHDFRSGLHKARDLITAAEPDALVIIGSNHFRGFFLDMMPAVTIGVAECLGAGEAGTPGGPLPLDSELARELTFCLVERGFDPAFSLRLTVDHGITHSLQHLVPALDIPIVPIVINMFAPPLPSLPRIYDLGRTIGEIIRSSTRNQRIGIVASGGLSHVLPWPKWYDACTDDERFLVQAWLNGRDSWPQYEVRRRQIIRAAAPRINPEFDRRFLGMLGQGDISPVVKMTSQQLEEEGGNGAQEIRSWIAMAAALGAGGGFSGTALAYAPIEEWLTGMGIFAGYPREKA
jgi:2,3-dihydroxyphenylpropionate 1,2-dioxygenase